MFNHTKMKSKTDKTAEKKPFETYVCTY